MKGGELALRLLRRHTTTPTFLTLLFIVQRPDAGLVTTQQNNTPHQRTEEREREHRQLPLVPRSLLATTTMPSRALRRAPAPLAACVLLLLLSCALAADEPKKAETWRDHTLNQAGPSCIAEYYRIAADEFPSGDPCEVPVQQAFAGVDEAACPANMTVVQQCLGKTSVSRLVIDDMWAVSASARALSPPASSSLHPTHSPPPKQNQTKPTKKTKKTDVRRRLHGPRRALPPP